MNKIEKVSEPSSVSPIKEKKVLTVRKDFASHLSEECQKRGVNIFDGKIFNGQVIK